MDPDTFKLDKKKSPTIHPNQPIVCYRQNSDVEFDNREI